MRNVNSIKDHAHMTPKKVGWAGLAAKSSKFYRLLLLRSMLVCMQKNEPAHCFVLDSSGCKGGACGVAEESLQKRPEQRRRRWLDGCPLECLERQRGHFANHIGQRVSVDDS